MTRYLGIDYGTKRIGLAVGDNEAGVASPVATIEGPAQQADQVRAVLESADQYRVDEFVLGLPVNMDGTEGAQARLTRAFGALLARSTGRPVHYWDERLSTAAAQQLLEPAGLSRKKKAARVDRVAAQVLLQGFLDARTGQP